MSIEKTSDQQRSCYVNRNVLRSVEKLLCKQKRPLISREVVTSIEKYSDQLRSCYGNRKVLRSVEKLLGQQKGTLISREVVRVNREVIRISREVGRSLEYYSNQQSSCQVNRMYSDQQRSCQVNRKVLRSVEKLFGQQKNTSISREVVMPREKYSDQQKSCYVNRNDL